MKSYRYVDGEFVYETEIKRSRFIATVKGELDSYGADEFVKSVKRRYSDATHNCYAYVADEAGNLTRYSDDGEPSGTAGQPILEVIKKSGLKKTAVVVTRYFGGIKLGAGGLVGAYSGTAAEALFGASTAVKAECRRLSVNIDYNLFTAAENAARKYGYPVENVNYAESVSADIFVPSDEAQAFEALVRELSAGRAEIEKCGLPQYKKIQIKEI